MNELIVKSKAHGTIICLLDKKGWDIANKFGNGNGRWCARLNNQRRKFYFQKAHQGKIYELHRLIVGAKKGDYVDHINGNTLDNRSINLRICTNGANLRNAKLRKGNPSGARGVGWDKVTQSWTAQIKVNYRRIWLGRHKTLKSAIQARKQAEIKYWGV